MSLRAKVYVDFENIYYGFFPPKDYGRPDQLVLQKGPQGKKELEDRYKIVIEALDKGIRSIVDQIKRESGECDLRDIEVFADSDEFIGLPSLLDDAGYRYTYVRKFDKDLGKRNNAVDIKMSNTIMLEIDDFDIFILAMADKDYKDALDTLHARVKKIGVIGLENITPQRVLMRASYYRALKPQKLELPRITKLPLRLIVPQAFLFRAIALRAHRLLVENQWPMVHINKLVESIGGHNWFKNLSKSDWYDWVNQARDKRVLITYRSQTKTGNVATFLLQIIPVIYGRIFLLDLKK